MEASTLSIVDNGGDQEFMGLQDYLQSYLDQERFRSAYFTAHQRWQEASEMLYEGDSRDSVLAAAARAREAVEEFVGVLAEKHGEIPADQGSPVATCECSFSERLSTLIESWRPQLGEARCALLGALLDYWCALNAELQCHLQGAEQVGGPLRWEDGRRVVVLTAVLMVEIDRSL